ncbi:MAG TPA: PQQ-binding-like beta-propeller repeat protein [Candidatus Polarisedimenticolaceae bacterium]|nr:PQQ-binding-like beta-propeller repeat protein [Candidatus Polarisedimenticolaceae bacterium]
MPRAVPSIQAAQRGIRWNSATRSSSAFEVLALDPATGSVAWRTFLKGGSFVNVTFDGQRVVAATKGEVFALDPATGHILWNNRLEGMGLGFVTIAGAGQVPAMAQIQKNRDDAGGAAAGMAAAAGS